MDRKSAEFLEGEISIVSQLPFRLAIIIYQELFDASEGESLENLYNNLPSLKKLKPIWNILWSHISAPASQKIC